ncbi:MAG: alpha-glucosidase C-terminal domain-containing protein, partial [Bacteroidales bacterium]
PIIVDTFTVYNPNDRFAYQLQNYSFDILNAYLEQGDVDLYVRVLETEHDKDLILLAEGARNDHFTAGFHMNYSWTFYTKFKQVFNENVSADDLVSIHLSEYNSLPSGKHKLRFTTNHDESAWDATPMVIFNGENGALAASVIAIYLGGVPLIYGSQEVGVIDNVPFFSNAPINWSLHPEMLQAYKSILNFYNGSESLRMGELTSYPNTDVLAFERIHEQKEVLVFVNVRNNAVTYDIPEALENTAWLDAFSNLAVTLPEVIDLGPYSYIVLIK